jgi:UDP-N-acetylglucosamine--N-acetylmuramyl-(pentapeptide) pyrophosphoryl-undecaprenol N-acetylglucosamine transferase
VAHELRGRGHRPFFVGTRQGIEARLVPAGGFPIEWIEIGGLKRAGVIPALRTLGQIPRAVVRVLGALRVRRPAAVFSMGGYVAGPAVAAAWLRRIPIVLMEPNAVAGLTNRWIGRFASRAMVVFEEAAAQFPRGRTELAGLPVREGFFAIRPKPRGETLTLLVTGGSRGSRRLNEACRASWPLFRRAGFAIRILHQSGREDHRAMSEALASSGIEGEVVPFFEDMPAAFAQADLVVCRSGAGAVAELAAAGKPSILAPFPFAADQHQLRNAEAMARAGAARVVLDAECDGERIFREVANIAADPETLDRMGQAARALARPRAAERAADLLEELAAAKVSR